MLYIGHTECRILCAPDTTILILTQLRSSEWRRAVDAQHSNGGAVLLSPALNGSMRVYTHPSRCPHKRISRTKKASFSASTAVKCCLLVCSLGISFANNASIGNRSTIAARALQATNRIWPGQTPLDTSSRNICQENTNRTS